MPLIKKNAASDASLPPPTPSHNNHAGTPQHSASAAASTPQATVSPQQLPSKPGMSDGEHLLHLLSSNKGHYGDFSEHSGDEFNAAFEDSGAAVSPAFDSVAVAAASRNQRGPSDLLLGEGVSSGGHATTTPTASATAAAVPAASPASSSIHGLGGLMRHGGHLDPAAPATKYVQLPPDAPNAAAAARLATLKHVHFDVNSKAYSTFFLHDYSWKEHGYALVHRYYQGFASLIDNEWDTIFSLTYNTVADKQGVDTTPFRTAIWYLTHRLFGLQHDDFDYGRIPVFLTPALKTFVRKIVCAPDTITREDYELKGYNFKPDEKCHIVLLAIEARRQASLLYALHALMKFMR
jgi:hypothetical protein